MKNKKLNIIITISVIVLILLLGGIFFGLNYSRDDSSLSVMEKKWITDNENKIVDIDVFNNVPVYGYNGSGIIFEFLDYFTKEYGIEFNKVSYYDIDRANIRDLSFLILNSNEEVGDLDILLYEDHYVVLSKDRNDYINIGEVNSVGVLQKDQDLVKNYFGEGVEYFVYENINQLIEWYNLGQFNYLVLPNNEYMSTILSNSYNIVYHVNDLEKKYVLRTHDETLYNVFNKSYLKYKQDEYVDDYSNNYLNLYFDSKGISDLDRKNYNAKAYKYGYVINMPYENYVNKSFVGTISNYLKDFEMKTDVEIEVVRYDNINDLKNAFVNKEVDFVLGNFDYSGINSDIVVSNTLNSIDYLVLSKNDIVVNSLKGLNKYKVSVVLGSKLYDLCVSNGVETLNYANTDELLRSLDDNSVALIDKETYLYYKNAKLMDYKIIYEDSIDNGYKFVMNASNSVFNNIFSYYISTINYDSYKYKYNTNISIERDYTLYKVVAFLAALISLLVSTILLINRKNVTNTVISKEDKLKYLDPMTSLKNRNYLNKNIYNWDDNVIFPQSIVVIDLNDIKEVNDKLGREAGDEVIKRVASVLINNQLENTDIIRSGGDEFLIYMVGYEEKKVNEYIKTLVKEMKEIPNSYGVETGYSMILDEVKSVDDAINEAILMMNKNKEKRKEK